MLKMILLDDDPSTLEAMGDFVRLWSKDVEIQSFEDAELAWKELSRRAPDILITDFYHNPPNGEQMLFRLAEQQATFPILILSGGANKEQVRRCAGPNLTVSFLKKPWTLNQLSNELTFLLGQPKSGR